MDEIEVPFHFLCPISLQLMRDPVTISTGITYDRDTIEKWFFSYKNTTCPVTNQLVIIFNVDVDQDRLMITTPNHTLRRLIQSWCTLNACPRIPTPKQPLNRNEMAKLVEDAKSSPHLYLKRLKSIILENERNQLSFLGHPGAIEFLVSLVNEDVCNSDHVEEALSILYHLKISENQLRSVLTSYNGDELILESLLRIMKSGDYQSRAYSTMLLKSIFEIAEPLRIINIRKEMFSEIVRVLRDQISQQATKAALKILIEVCPWGRNRIKAVEGGAVRVLIESLLVEITDKRANELMLTVLDVLCGCAEGRAELVKHGAGLAVVSKKILRVSHVGSDRAVRILCSICRFSSSCRVLQEMLEVGVVAKLCLVLQVESSLKSKERAKEMLKLHSRVWRNSHCIPSHLMAFYPS